MSNPQKAKGDRAEVAVVNWLRSQGVNAERIRAGRSTDPGDITWPGSRWLCDVKDQQRWRVQEWLTEAEEEAAAEGVSPLLVVKRPGIVDPGRWAVVSTVASWWGV